MVAEEKELSGQTIYIQLLEDSSINSPWKACYLKKGTKKKPMVQEESK